MGESGERAIFAVKEADAPRNPLMIALFFINIVWLRLLGGVVRRIEWFPRIGPRGVR